MNVSGLCSVQAESGRRPPAIDHRRNYSATERLIREAPAVAALFRAGRRAALFDAIE